MSAKSFLWLLVAVQALHGQSLINVDFGVGSGSAKTGYAATGHSTNDIWNLYRHYDPKFVPGMPLVPDGVLANAKYADRTESRVTVMVTNAPGVWGNATGDPMYDSYIFAQNGSNIVVAIHHLEPARYHFYLYGHADADVTGEQNSIFTLRTGTNSFGPASAASPSGPYRLVVFRDVEVSAEEPVLIEVAAGPNGIPVLNGMQIISRGTSPPRFIPAVAAATPTTLTNIIFKEIRYAGKVTDTEARFAVSLDVQSLTTNEISGVLFEGDVAVIASEIPNGLRMVTPVSGLKQYGLIVTRPGSYRLNFEVIARITKSEPWNEIDFTGPPAAIAHVSARAAAGIEMNFLSGVDGFLGTDRNVHLRWHSKTAEVARKSLLTVDTTVSALVTPTVVKYTTQLRYEILQAGVSKLTIAVPAGHTITRVQGEHIRDWQVSDNQVLNIELTRSAERSYTLVLNTEQAIESTPAAVAMTAPRPLNVERESGAFNVAVDDMTLALDTINGLRQVNAPKDSVAAFRFYGRPFELDARVQRIEPVLKVTDRVSARLEETRLLVEHALTLSVEKAGLYFVDFATQAGFTVSDVTGEGIDDWKATNGALRVTFSNRVLGTRKINVQLEQPQTAFPQQFTVLSLRTAGATSETAEVGVGSGLGIRLKTGADLAGVRETPVAGSADEVLAFRSEQPDWRLTVAAERLPARVVAEIFNLVTIGDGLVGGSATIRYGIINQGVQEFRVRLPVHWKNVEFTGSNIRRKELVTAPDIWAITLQDKAWGGYTLVITYDYQFDPKSASLDLAGAHAVDIERESGSLAITTAANLKLEPKTVIDPLRVIDQSELSDADRSLVTRPVLLAYRYAGPAFALALDVTRYQEVAVLDAVADRTQLTSVVSEEGQMVTQASFMVKNNDKQYQKFRLPAGATLWGCYVNGEPVKGELDGDWLAVSLPRGANRDQAFGVDIVYAQKFGAFQASALPRNMALVAPKTDVPNTYAEWEMYVPPTRRLSGFGGNMDVARGTTYGLADGWRRFIAFYSRILPTSRETIPAPITSLAANAPAQMSTGVPAIEGRSEIGGLAGAGDRFSRLTNAPLVAGIRPVRIDLPRVGRPFTFTKVMNVTDEPLSVKVSVMKEKWFVAWRSLLQFTALATGLLILLREWRRSSFRSALGVALSLGAIGSVLVAVRALHIVLIILVPAVLLIVLVWFLRKYWPRRVPAPQLNPGPATAAIAIGLFVAFNASAAPTNEFSIVSAEYAGRVHDKIVQFDATMRVSTFATNQVVPLFGEGVAIQEFKPAGPENGATLMRDGNGVSLRLGPAGDTVLKFKVAVKIGGDTGKRQLAFTIPPALASKLALTIDEGDADVEFPTAVSFQRTSGDKQTQVDAILGSGDRVDVNWTPRVKRVADMAASIFAQHAALVTVGNGAINARSVIEYQMTQGELRQAKVRVPAGYRLLRVEGDSIRTWELAPEGQDEVLVVELLKGVTPTYRLVVETEKMMDSLPAGVEIVVPQILNVIRETGIVGIRSMEEMALTIGETRDLQRVDAAEFARGYGEKGSGVANAYRFLKPGFSISAQTEPVTPQVEAVVRNALHVGFDQVSLAATVDYTIKRAGVFTLRLEVPPEFRMDAVNGHSNVLHWAQNGPAIEVTLKNRAIGVYSLSVQMSRPHKDLPPTLELAGVRPLGTQKLTGFVSVTSEAGIALKTSKFDGLLEVPASGLGENVRSGMLAFKQLNTWKLVLATAMVESWVRAEIVNIISVSETLLTGRAVVRYDIQNAPVKGFRLKVPDMYRNVEILGTNIRERDQSNGVWRVELQNKVRGSFQLAMTFEQPIDAKTNALALNGIEALGVERETGSVVVLTKAPLQVIEKNVTDPLLKIDARELPDWAGVSATAEAALVYRYLRPGFQLACELRRFGQAAVLQALIDSAVLTTVVADDGQTMTEMALKIRNNGLQHLEIELPARTRLWSAFVAGQPVRPAQRGNRLLLPIDRTAAQDVPIAVELTYVGLERFPKGKGTLALASPRLDVPLKNARWDVFLPLDYDYSKFAGTMTHEASFAPEVQVYSATEYQRREFARDSGRKSDARSSLDRAKNMLSAGKLKDANEDFKQALNYGVVADAENLKEIEVLKRELDRAQSSNLIQAQRAYTVDNLRKAGADQADKPVQQFEEKAAKLVAYDDEVAERQWNALQKAQEVTVAKVQPLRVNLPTRGLRQTFTQVLQTEVNKPMTIRFSATNSEHIGWLKLALNAIAGFLVLWLLTANLFKRRNAETTA